MAQRSSVNAPPETVRKLSRISARWGISQTQTMVRAVDVMESYGDDLQQLLLGFVNENDRDALIGRLLSRMKAPATPGASRQLIKQQGTPHPGTHRESLETPALEASGDAGQ